MSRRQVGSTRRNGTFPFSGAFHSKSRSSPLLSIGLVVVVIFKFYMTTFVSAASGRDSQFNVNQNCGSY